MALTAKEIADKMAAAEAHASLNGEVEYDGEDTPETEPLQNFLEYAADEFSEVVGDNDGDIATGLTLGIFTNCEQCGIALEVPAQALLPEDRPWRIVGPECMD